MAQNPLMAHQFKITSDGRCRFRGGIIQRSHPNRARNKNKVAGTRPRKLCSKSRVKSNSLRQEATTGPKALSAAEEQEYRVLGDAICIEGVMIGDRMEIMVLREEASRSSFEPKTIHRVCTEYTPRTPNVQTLGLRRLLLLYRSMFTFYSTPECYISSCGTKRLFKRHTGIIGRTLKPNYSVL